MVSITQNDPSIDLALEPLEPDTLDRPLGPDGHKDGRFDNGASRRYRSGTCLAVLRDISHLRALVIT